EDIDDNEDQYYNEQKQGGWICRVDEDSVQFYPVYDCRMVLLVSSLAGTRDV
ncbi:unnamed protein product, partial [Urochloa humidicola]